MEACYAVTSPAAERSLHDLLNVCGIVWPAKAPEPKPGDLLHNRQGWWLIQSLARTTALIELSGGELSTSLVADSLQSFLRRLMGCITETMQWAHSHNVQHLNLTPSNLLLQDGYLYVTDFGIGLDNEDNASDTDLVTFRAPEATVKDKRSLEQRDAYSLGCIMLYITTIMYGITSSRGCKDLLNKHRLKSNKHGPEIQGLLKNPHQDAPKHGDNWPSPQLVKVICSILVHDPESRPRLHDIAQQLKDVGTGSISYLGPCCGCPELTVLKARPQVPVEFTPPVVCQTPTQTQLPRRTLFDLPTSPTQRQASTSKAPAPRTPLFRLPPSPVQSSAFSSGTTLQSTREPSEKSPNYPLAGELLRARTSLCAKRDSAEETLAGETKRKCLGC